MARPLLRGIPGEERRISDTNHASWDPIDPQMKENKDDSHPKHENGFASDLFTISTPRTPHRFGMLLIKISLVLIAIMAVVGSFRWTVSITSSKTGHVDHSYRRLQEQLVLDFASITGLSQGPAMFTELDLCSDEYENFVPCYNVLDQSHGDVGYCRDCKQSVMQDCLVVPPSNYRAPLRWPTGRDVIWGKNVKLTGREILLSGSLTKRMMMIEEDQISFHSESLTSDSIEDYSHQIAEMIGLTSASDFVQAGVRNILDIGCGYGTFGAHLFSKELLTMCIAPYESSGSQVQFTLERGLPAIIAPFTSTQLPFPSLSFDMLHCSRCGIHWDDKDGLYLIEVDRVLRPGGYFVWTSPLINAGNKLHEKRWKLIHKLAENMCWESLSQQDETVVWKKPVNRSCYYSRKINLCSKSHDVESPYYRPLQMCIGGTHSPRWLPIEERSTWPSRAKMNENELKPYGLQQEELAEDGANWNTDIGNYWSLLSPLIFSDHPKRPADEDPSPPFNMFRNVLDMNAHFGGFNAALLETGKSVWVMNVVPKSGLNYLPLILDRGFVGVLHDWCEAFPTYPRSYDMVHAHHLLSLENNPHSKCTTLDILVEVDRILRPEGWVIFRDDANLIESTRPLLGRLRWEARVIEIEANNDEKLLICQKPFLKKHGG